MKKLKISLLALLLTVGIGGAVVQKIHAAPRETDTFYNWVSSSIAPENPSSSLLNSTHDQAVDRFGCEDGASVCANGSIVSGPGPSTDQLKVDE